MRINFNPIFNQRNNFQNKRNIQPALKNLSVDTFSFQGVPAPLYSIDFNGQVKRYDNLTCASKETGCRKNTISDVIGARRSCSDGFIFVKPNMIELKDEFGNISLDRSKINKIRERFLHTDKNYPIVMISQDGKTEIYETVKTACNETRLPSSSFFRALAQPKYGVGSRVVARLSDVVLLDKDENVVFDSSNNFVLDDKKIRNYYSQYFCKGKTIADISFTGTPRKIYAYDYDGNFYQFNSQIEASNALGMARSRVTDSIRKEEITHGYAFVFADDIQKQDSDELDSKKASKLIERFSSAYNMPICIIDLNGKISRYQNYKEMSEKTGINQDRISDVINRDNHYYESKGVLIVKENDILLRDESFKTKKDENGNYIYDLNKVAKLMEAFMEGKIKPVIARNIKNGAMYTFKSATEAARFFSLPKQTFDDYLKSDNRIYADYRFEYYDTSKIEEFLGV